MRKLSLGFWFRHVFWAVDIDAWCASCAWLRIDGNSSPPPTELPASRRSGLCVSIEGCGNLCVDGSLSCCSVETLEAVNALVEC